MKILNEEEKKIILDSLEEQKQFIAFDYPYGPLGHTIVVSTISFINKDKISCHFSMGYSGECHDIKREDIIAIADPNGDTKLCGRHGIYIVLRPETLKKCEDGRYELLNENLDI